MDNYKYLREKVCIAHKAQEMIHMDKIETLLSCRDIYEHLGMEATASYIDDKISEELMRRDK